MTLPLFQVGGCGASTLTDAVQAELSRLVSTFVFTIAETVALNLLDA